MSMALAMMGPGAMDSFKKSWENNIAAVGQARANGDGVRFDFHGITAAPSPSSVEDSPERLVSFAPKDASVTMAVAGFDKVWAEFRKQLMENPSVREQIGT